MEQIIRKNVIFAGKNIVHFRVQIIREWDNNSVFEKYFMPSSVFSDKGRVLTFKHRIDYKKNFKGHFYQFVIFKSKGHN